MIYQSIAVLSQTDCLQNCQLNPIQLQSDSRQTPSYGSIYDI